MRKLIFLAFAAWAVKKLTRQMEAGGGRAPFPTSSRPPEGYSG